LAIVVAPVLLASAPRAQTWATFKRLFNELYSSTEENAT